MEEKVTNIKYSELVSPPYTSTTTTNLSPLLAYPEQLSRPHITPQNTMEAYFSISGSHFTSFIRYMVFSIFILMLLAISIPYTYININVSILKWTWNKSDVIITRTIISFFSFSQSLHLCKDSLYIIVLNLYITIRTYKMKQ